MQFPLPSDLPDTPSGAFSALGGLAQSYWLDSGDKKGHHARYHFLGSRPKRTMRWKGTEPFGTLRHEISALHNTSNYSMPAARLVGWLAYDVGQYLERLPELEDAIHDETYMALYDACVTYDLTTGEAAITATSTDAAEQLIADLRRPPAIDAGGPAICGTLHIDVGLEQYTEQIQQVEKYIAQGDVYQVNLSHRIDATLHPESSPWLLYKRLRDQHPACFGAYVDTGELQLLSNSPECFLAVDLSKEHRSVATWPLKGTRPSNVAPDVLRNDPKDQAEHVMIVDLERNDLGRIAVPGSVQVPQLMEIVSHSTVHHLESRVEAVPKPGIDLIDILSATFPGGSITGAPKIRAMEIISTLEGERRGPYCGALGYVDWTGQRSCWNIPIRTAVVDGNSLSLRVGGGVVSDSIAEQEYQETLTKGQAFLDILT